jgi:hypothetical protein
MKPTYFHSLFSFTVSLVMGILVEKDLHAQKDSSGINPFYLKGGISFILGGTKTSDNVTFVPAVTVAPGWRFVKSREFALSLEAPISAGVSFNNNNVSLGVELPVTVNLNVGLAASADSKGRFGWSLGIGKGYHYSYNEYSFDYDDDENDELSLWGTVIQTAFHFRGGCVRFHWISNFSDQPVRKDAIGIGLLAMIE